MAMREVIAVFFSLFLAASRGEASGLEPGSPLMVPRRPAEQKPPEPPPRASEVSLARFLESPGRDAARVRLWLRHNREARAVEEGVREFLARLIDITTEAPPELVFSHERVMLDAEALAADAELLALADARTQLLSALGRQDPDLQVLEGERFPPWARDGQLDREALAGRVFARTGRAPALPVEVDRLLAELTALDRRLDSQELELLPVAEESLGAVLLGLTSGEATMMEVVHALHFLKHQQRRRLDLRIHRELLLMEVARRAGCSLEALPWTPSVEPG